MQTYSYQIPSNDKTDKVAAKLEDDYRADPVKACRKALRMTAHLSERVRLEAIETFQFACRDVVTVQA